MSDEPMRIGGKTREEWALWSAIRMGVFADHGDFLSLISAAFAPYEEDAARTLKSICVMLGWGNVPPQRTLEMEIAELKRRAQGDGRLREAAGAAAALLEFDAQFVPGAATRKRVAEALRAALSSAPPAEAVAGKATCPRCDGTLHDPAKPGPHMRPGCHPCPACAPPPAAEVEKAAWKIEAESWEREVKEFDHPIGADHDHHEIRDWLNDAFVAGEGFGVEKAAKMLEQRVFVLAFENESIRFDVIRRIRALSPEARDGKEEV